MKSRALENHLYNNRIEDIPDGNSSRLIDLPNCGRSFVIGNDLHKSATSLNLTAIGYGHEGCLDRTEAQKALYVISNTFVNEARQGTLVDNRAKGEVLVANNLIVGNAITLSGKGQDINNLHAKTVHRATYD